MESFFVIVHMLGIFISGGMQVTGIDFITSGDNIFYGDQTAIFNSLSKCESKLKEIIIENSTEYDSQSVSVVNGKIMENITTEHWMTVAICQEIKHKKPD